MPRIPTPLELHEAFEMFSRTLTGSFALYIWKMQLLPYLVSHQNEIGSALVIGRNAAIQSSLVCVRSLDDFFLPPVDAHFEHDVLAHDFGFTQVGSPLGTPERTRINRLIVHMSYEPLWNSSAYVGPSGDRSFDLAAMLVLVGQRSIAFLDYCTTIPLFSDAESTRKVDGLRKLTGFQLANVQAIARLERPQL